MMTVIAVHEVNDVDHWLASPKRDEFFAAHGMTVKTFVDPAGGNRVGVMIQNVPSLDALETALGGPMRLRPWSTMASIRTPWSSS